MQMRNAVLFVLALVLFLIVSCKEEIPGGLILIKKDKPLLDTCYTLSSLVTPQPKTVLLIDITGVRCVNCPKAADIAKDIEENSSGRVIVMGVHPTSLQSLTLPWPGYDTMSNAESELIAAQFGLPVGLPSGMVDQILYNGNRYVTPQNWQTVVNGQLAKSSSWNIEAKSTFDNASKSARLEIKNIYNTNTSTTNPYLMFAAVVESKIVGKQKDSRFTPDEILDYEHNHVFRNFISSSSGDTLNKCGLSLNTVYEKHYKFKMNSKWKPQNCKLIVWIVDAGSKEIIQTKQISIQ